MTLADGFRCEEEALAILHVVGGSIVSIRVSICLRHFHGDVFLQRFTEFSKYRDFCVLFYSFSISGTALDTAGTS